MIITSDRALRSLLAVSAALALVSPARAADLREDAAPPAQAAVEVRGQVLFEVQAPTGQLQVPQRAARIGERVLAALRAGRRGGDVRIETRGEVADVYAGPDFVFSVWEQDAARAGMPLPVLAAERAQRCGAPSTRRPTRRGRGRCSSPPPAS